MNEDVAVRLLADMTGRDQASAAALVDDYRTLAAYKYDSYQGYGPGLRFLASVVRWIAQFDPADRALAATFARERILFVSQAELRHLVELVYPSVIRPALVATAAEHLGLPAYRRAAVTASAEYGVRQRQTLVVGLSDGARLDLLRRVTPELRHEQFVPAPEVVPGAASGGPRLVVLVDDFAATGTTLLRFERGQWGGRLWDAHHRLRGHHVRVVLYLATELARRRLGALLAESGLGWDVAAVHTIPDDVRITADRHPDVHALCERYADGSSVNYVPDATGPLAFGCGGAALPLVLYHNTPDNSISLLWQDRPAVGRERRVVPLFARYERYPVPAGAGPASLPSSRTRTGAGE